METTVFYKELEDIWNYRAELTPTMKLKRSVIVQKYEKSENNDEYYKLKKENNEIFSAENR